MNLFCMVKFSFKLKIISQLQVSYFNSECCPLGTQRRQMYQEWCTRLYSADIPPRELTYFITEWTERSLEPGD